MGGGDGEDGGGDYYFLQAENEICARRDAVARASVDARCLSTVFVPHISYHQAPTSYGFFNSE